MGYRAYKGHAELDIDNLRAFGICDRCGQLHNHDMLSWQYEFQGPTLKNIRILVCPECLDDPNPTDMTIVLPPDPIPVYNARPPRKSDLLTIRTTNAGQQRVTDAGQPRISDESVDPSIDEDIGPDW